jgi:phosphoglycolate phosphatase-like HAD superfamily hydrolase
MGVLIDLDLTLIDSRVAEPMRKARRWPAVYEMIPEFTPYEGISDLMAELIAKEVAICVVTSSPKPYCERVVKHFKWEGIEMVCYHDTARRKPYPDPIQLGLRKLGVRRVEAISIGDDPRDTAAAKAAGVFSIGALWGALDRAALIESRPDALCKTVAELRNIVFTRLSL